MDIFSIFFNMTVYCEFPLESPHWGDSIVYTLYAIFIIKNHPRLFQICSYEMFT